MNWNGCVSAQISIKTSKRDLQGIQRDNICIIY